MKLIKNWGWGIFYLYSAFALTIIGIVIFISVHQADLVETNYYDNGTNYQKQINKISNSEKFQKEFSVERKNPMLILNYPKNLTNFVNGSVLFYCVSDSKKDFTIPISIDSAKKQYVPINTFIKGLWQAKVSLSIADSSYYLEQNFKID